MYSVLIQFTDGYFNETMQSTIGVDFKVKVMDAVGADSRHKRVKVTIWDTGRTCNYIMMPRREMIIYILLSLFLPSFNI